MSYQAVPIDEIGEAADEMLLLIAKCPVNGVTKRDVALAYLKKQFTAGKAQATRELADRLNVKLAPEAVTSAQDK